MRQVTLTRAFLAAAFFTTVLASAQSSTAFVHKATGSTITSSKTILDTASLNGNSNLNLMVTHNYNPGGGAGAAVDKVLGFRFQSLKWYVIHQDNSAFNANTYYNVFVPGDDTYSWSHTTTASNTTNNYTIINDGRINNNPNAKVFIANNLANYNNKVNGVFYSISQNKWCIYNQAGVGDEMEENLEFNIIVPKGTTDFTTLLHTANGNNTINHYTTLNHSDLNNNPDAIVFVTQVYNPGGTQSGVYNNHNVGVQYRNNNKWNIYNEDLVNMPAGASFNVIIFKNSTIGIDEISLNTENVKIFPNPAAWGNITSVALDQNVTGQVNMEVYSISGQLMLTSQFHKSQAEQIVSLNTASLVPGMYVLKVESKGKVGAQRLIIQ